MATLIRVWKSPRRRDQSQFTAPVNKPTEIAGQEIWMVLYDGSDVDQWTAAHATGLPIPGGVYGAVRCKSVMATRTSENPNLWECQVQYETPQPSDGGANFKFINLSYGTVVYEDTAYKDRIGQPLCNVNGEFLPSLPPQRHYDEQINISFQTTNITQIATIRGCIGKVSSDNVSFTIAGLSFSYLPRQMLLEAAPIQATSLVGFGTSAIHNYSVSLQLHCKTGTVTIPSGTGTTTVPNTFKFRAPNEGWKELIPATGSNDAYLTAAILKDGAYAGSAPSSPVKLDILGAQVSTTNATALILPEGGPALFSSVAGRFELEDQTAFSGLFTGLNDNGT
jgi:hypothetical protein